MRSNLRRWLIATAIVTIGLVLCGIVTLPVSWVLFSAPFVLEDALFGTAYLFNMLPFFDSLLSLLCCLIPVGLLLLPLLGNNKRRVLLLAGFVYVGLPVALVSFIGVISMLDNRWPPETIGPDPRLVSDALPLETCAGINTMEWSPDGRFVAIGVDTDSSYYGVDGKDQIIILIEVETGQSVAQVSEASEAFWASDNRLWVLSESHWHVYAEPFAEAERIALGYESKTDHPFDYKSWDFDPDTQILAVAELSDDGTKWSIRVWQEGMPVYQIQLTPKHRALGDGGARGLRLSLSPDGTYLALIVGGWVAFEQPGPEELWLLQVAEGELKFLHEGKTKAWKVWDYEVQNLNPSWSQDGKEIVVADYTFGVERIDVETGRTRRILGWNSRVHDVRLSYSGEWMAFERWSENSEDDDLCRRCVGVLSVGGKYITYLPEAKVGWQSVWYDWHPRNDVLALLTKQEDHYRLLTWDLSTVQYR